MNNTPTQNLEQTTPSLLDWPDLFCSRCKRILLICSVKNGFINFKFIRPFEDVFNGTEEQWKNDAGNIENWGASCMDCLTPTDAQHNADANELFKEMCKDAGIPE